MPNGETIDIVIPRMFYTPLYLANGYLRCKLPFTTWRFEGSLDRIEYEHAGRLGCSTLDTDLQIS